MNTQHQKRIEARKQCARLAVTVRGDLESAYWHLYQHDPHSKYNDANAYEKASRRAIESVENYRTACVNAGLDTVPFLGTCFQGSDGVLAHCQRVINNH